MGRTLTRPCERLAAAASLAAACFSNTEKITAIDVGCDHAKLSIYLVQSGICSHVLAADVVDGPLAVARENVGSRTLMGKSLADYIDIRKNDGIAGFEKEAADAVFILGMGGELIASILERGEAFRKSHQGTLYILQAMTSEPFLRRYLAEHGFRVVNECTVTDKGRVYAITVCIEDGEVRHFAPYAYELGTYLAEHPNREMLPYLERKIRIFDKLTKELAAAGKDAEPETEMLRQFKLLRERIMEETV